MSPAMVPVVFLNTVLVAGAREDEGQELFAKAHNRQFYYPICIPGMEHLNSCHQQLQYALKPTTIFKLGIENPVTSLLAVSGCYVDSKDILSIASVCSKSKTKGKPIFGHKYFFYTPMDFELHNNSCTNLICSLHNFSCFYSTLNLWPGVKMQKVF